jgi:hypothetical protein
MQSPAQSSRAFCLFGLRYPALRLLSDAQLGQVGTNLVERGGHLARFRQMVELVRGARAILQ